MHPAVALTQELIARPSVTPEDGGCQQMLAERLAALGFHIEHLHRGGVSNLWARRGAQEPLLCLAGHSDVVPPGPRERWLSDPFQPELRDGLLYGRGAADMKGGLAAMVTACEAFVAEHPRHRGSLAFLITSDEEGPAKDGTLCVLDHLRERGERIDYCVLGEPSSEARTADHLKVGRRGSLNGRLNILGKQGHVAYPHLSDNPVHRFAPALQELCATVWDQGNDYFPPTSFQISNLNAGTGAENVIPGELEILFNLRFSTALTQTAIEERVKDLLERHQLRYELTWNLSGPPFLTTAPELIAACDQAVEAVLGYRPESSTGGGTSDGRFIAPTGAQVVELGPSNRTIHQVNECVAVQELEDLHAIYLRIMQSLLG